MPFTHREDTYTEISNTVLANPTSAQRTHTHTHTSTHTHIYVQFWPTLKTCVYCTGNRLLYFRITLSF